MKAILRQIRISPKKANLVASLVRRKPVSEALDILKFTPKKTASVLRTLIQSAAANAENNFNQNPETLYVKEIIVTEGPTYKRSVPISRGRVHPRLKRTAHITVKVETQEVPELKSIDGKDEPEVSTEKTKVTEKKVKTVKKPVAEKKAKVTVTKAPKAKK